MFMAVTAAAAVLFMAVTEVLWSLTSLAASSIVG